VTTGGVGQNPFHFLGEGWLPSDQRGELDIGFPRVLRAFRRKRNTRRRADQDERRTPVDVVVELIQGALDEEVVDRHQGQQWYAGEASHLAKGSSCRHAVGLGDLETDVTGPSAGVLIEFRATTLTPTEFGFQVGIDFWAIDLLIHGGVDVGRGANVRRHRQSELRRTLPWLLAFAWSIACFKASSLQFIVGANAHDLASDLPPNPLRVCIRHHRQVQTKVFWQRAGFCQLRHRRFTVRNDALFHGQDLGAESFLALVQEGALGAILLPVAVHRVGLIPIQALRLQQFFDLFLLRNGRVVAWLSGTVQTPTLQRVRHNQGRHAFIAACFGISIQHHVHVVAAHVCHCAQQYFVLDAIKKAFRDTGFG